MRKINLPRTIRWDDGSVKMIDQTKLPFELDILEITDHKALGRCIREMNVRGAPAIGASAAYGLALASLEYGGSEAEELWSFLEAAARYLKGMRPTAVNLSWAVDRVLGNVTKGSVEERRREIISEAKRIAEEDEETNRRIGQVGSDLIKDGYTIETHCNAGSLATVYYGTALAPVYHSWEEGKSLHVIVDETRPRLQGARLTAWELSYVGIPYTIITDSMAAHLMKRIGVDIVIVGADRIARNGDVANKIGTYSLAIVAREHGVPLYVAAPT
ncbi:MAG: S-methyl-5-thioribose-1-phosphate isomerase, partial [Candidatus Bathyarchaeia archaeon]